MSKYLAKLVDIGFRYMSSHGGQSNYRPCADFVKTGQQAEQPTKQTSFIRCFDSVSDTGLKESIKEYYDEFWQVRYGELDSKAGMAFWKGFGYKFPSVTNKCVEEAIGVSPPRITRFMNC